jgi:aspartate carbamoyltransferase regulatory subunit
MNTTLSVSAIQHGTVIDHITAGQALRIVHLLSLNAATHQVTIGLNLQSQSMGRKDLIKISCRALTPDEANDIVVFSPHVTINIIKDFQVSEKIKTHLPDSIRGVFVCLNPNCITHTEIVDSYFYIHQGSKDTRLTCHYCDRQFDRDQVRVKI